MKHETDWYLSLPSEYISCLQITFYIGLDITWDRCEVVIDNLRVCFSITFFSQLGNLVQQYGFSNRDHSFLLFHLFITPLSLLLGTGSHFLIVPFFFF